MTLRVKGREYAKDDWDHDGWGECWAELDKPGSVVDIDDGMADEFLDALAVAVAALRKEEHHSGDPSTRQNAENALKEIEGE